MKNRDNSRMTSIARKLNMDFWSRQLASFLLIDILLVGLAAGVFFAWREGIVPQGQEVADRYFIGDGWDSYQYVIESETGEMYRYPISRLVDLLRAPVIVLIVVQVVSLIDDLFFIKKIRKRLRPLYEMAVRTEQLSSLPPDSEKFASFERAISSLDPEEPGARVKTGDKELQSLEIAINNLLDRMRESYRQQERFVSDASHELRTPISVIQGYVNMLDRWGKDDPKILDESIEALKNESEHMKLLIEQLLFLARGDSGRNTLHPENFDLAAMVREVWEESAMIDEGHHLKGMTHCLSSGIRRFSSSRCGFWFRMLPSTRKRAVGFCSKQRWWKTVPLLSFRMRAWAWRSRKSSTSLSGFTAQKGREAEPREVRDWGFPLPSGLWTRTGEL